MFIAELTSVLQSLKVHEVRLGDVNNILTIRSYLMNRVSLKGVGVNAGAFALPWFILAPPPPWVPVNINILTLAPPLFINTHFAPPPWKKFLNEGRMNSAIWSANYLQ